MKKSIIAIMFAFVLLLTYAVGVRPAFADELDSNAKAMCLIDARSGEVAFEKNGDKKLPVASMTKIMTLCVIFDEIESGRLSLDTEIIASDNAQHMGGSQVFIESGGRYKTENLVKAIIICSANDACVALAEHIAGSEAGFVSMMNKKAEALGMTNTNFINCTGLPCVNAYSSAKDMCACMRELIRHEKYFEYAKIWMEDFVHDGGRITSISNTNKLLRRNIGVDAGKTGYTSEAMHCITATAKKDDARFIACVVGAPSSKERFDAAEKMLKYGFANFDSVALLKKGEKVETPAAIKRGTANEVYGVPERDYYAFTKKRVAPDEYVEITYTKTAAPIKAGEEIGYATVYKNGKECDRIALLAEKNVERRGLFRIFG